MARIIIAISQNILTLAVKKLGLLQEHIVDRKSYGHYSEESFGRWGLDGIPVGLNSEWHCFG